MKTWEYMVTGFGESLERRRIAFLEPLPASRVCGICGMLPSPVQMLPCGHALCQFCEDQTKEESTCPIDHLKYAQDNVVSINFPVDDLEQRRVLCSLAGARCEFDGTLKDMQCHIAECVADKHKCVKCGCLVALGDLFGHHRGCSGGDLSAGPEPAVEAPVSDTVRSSVFEKLGVVKKDAEALLRQRLPSGDSKSPDAHVVSSVMDRVVDLERELLRTGVGAKHQDHDATLQAPKVPVASGPYRAANKRGVFVATCVLNDVHSNCSVVGAEETERSIFSQKCALAGYTFRLKCQVESTSTQGVRVHFVFFLQSGEWDDNAEWPFAKKVTLVLSHPGNETRDIWLPVTIGERKVSGRKPVPGVFNNGYKTDSIEWNRVLEQGFVSKDKLYVHVEFE